VLSAPPLSNTCIWLNTIAVALQAHDRTAQTTASDTCRHARLQEEQQATCNMPCFSFMPSVACLMPILSGMCVSYRAQKFYGVCISFENLTLTSSWNCCPFAHIGEVRVWRKASRAY